MLFWLHLLYKLGKEKMKKLDVRISLLRLQACHGVACVCVCVYMSYKFNVNKPEEEEEKRDEQFSHPSFSARFFMHHS